MLSKLSSKYIILGLYSFTLEYKDNYSQKCQLTNSILYTASCECSEILNFIYVSLQKAFGSNGSVDSGCHDVQGGIGAVITSGTCTFVSKIGIKLDEDLVKVRVDKEQTISNRNSASSSSSSSSSSSDSSSGVDDGSDCADGVIIREGAKITEVGWETYAHGFGLR